MVTTYEKSDLRGFSLTCPFVSKFLVGPEDDSILPVVERFLLDIRVELIAPTQPAALARPPSDACCNDRPVFWSVLLNQSSQQIIFLHHCEHTRRAVGRDEVFQTVR